MTTRKPISLKKAEEEVRKVLSLKKKDTLDAPTCAVGLALDVSGSTTDYYMNGAIGEVFTRMLGVAKTFDDDGQMNVWIFNDNARQLEDANEDNYETFVNDKIVRRGLVGGGTSYSPVLNKITDFYFGSAAPKSQSVTNSVTVPKTGFFNKLFGKTETVVTTTDLPPEAKSEVVPSYVIFLTDGENASSDIAYASKAFETSQKHPIYWMLVGVGSHPERFKYLKDIADKYPNVGYLQFDDMDMDDATLYDGVISQEFVDWVSK